MTNLNSKIREAILNSEKFENPTIDDSDLVCELLEEHSSHFIASVDGDKYFLAYDYNGGCFEIFRLFLDEIVTV